jgi:hypothetical protein
MRWTVHAERSLYESEWISLRLADVELCIEAFKPAFRHLRDARLLVLKVG